MVIEAGDRQGIALLGATDEVVRAGGVLLNDLEHAIDVAVVGRTREVADSSRVGVDRAGIVVPASRGVDVQARAGAIRARPEEASQLALVNHVEVIASHRSRRSGVVTGITAGAELGRHVGRQVDGVDLVLGIASFLSADVQRVAIAAEAETLDVDRVEPDRRHVGVVAAADRRTRVASATHQFRDVQHVEGCRASAGFARGADCEAVRRERSSVVDASDLRHHRVGGEEVTADRLGELERTAEAGSHSVERHHGRVSPGRLHRVGRRKIVGRVTAVGRGNGLSRPRRQHTHHEDEESEEAFHGLFPFRVV